MTHKSLSPERLKALLADERTRTQALDELGDWVKDTTLIAGATPSTAYIVAWRMVEGIAATWENRAVETRVMR